MTRMRKKMLIATFEKALRELDPAARVLVLEVFPDRGLSLTEEVRLSGLQLRRLNDLLGPNYSVIETPGAGS